MTESADKIYNKESVIPDFFDNQIERNYLDYLVTTNQIPYHRIEQRKVIFSRNRLLKWLEDRENVEIRYNK